jgi:hypothetical protein
MVKSTARGELKRISRGVYQRIWGVQYVIRLKNMRAK